MPYASRPGAPRIYFEVTGDAGPWVLLIHGLGLSARFWFDLPARLAAAPGAACRVVTFDNRGVGRSDRPAPPYRMTEMAGDALAVLEAAAADSAYVVGISLGGMIAQHVALQQPHRVAGLALLATTPGLPAGRLPRPSALVTLLERGFSRRGSLDGLASLLLSPRDLPRADTLLAGWSEAMTADRRTLGGFLGQLAAAGTHSTSSRLSEIRCPTVVVGGEMDVLQPARNSELLARGIPGAHLEILPGAGHGLPLADPDLISRCLAQLRATSVS